MSLAAVYFNILANKLERCSNSEWVWCDFWVSCLFSPWERMHSIMDFCPFGPGVQREPQTALRVRRKQSAAVCFCSEVCVWCAVSVCLAVCVTHVDAEGHQVVVVDRVVCDWLSQMEGQLGELEGCSCVRGGEDDSSWVVHHRHVSSQYHL